MSRPSSGDDAIDVAIAIANAHRFFETSSGWAPPDDETLAEWVADGVCRCPDECLVEPREWCEHGLASWWLVLDALDDVEVPVVPVLSAPSPPSALRALPSSSTGPVGGPATPTGSPAPPAP